MQKYEFEVSESFDPECTDESSEVCEAASDQTEFEEEDADEANDEL